MSASVTAVWGPRSFRIWFGANRLAQILEAAQPKRCAVCWSELSESEAGQSCNVCGVTRGYRDDLISRRRLFRVWAKGVFLFLAVHGWIALAVSCAGWFVAHGVHDIPVNHWFVQHGQVPALDVWGGIVTLFCIPFLASTVTPFMLPMVLFAEQRERRLVRRRFWPIALGLVICVVPGLVMLHAFTDPPFELFDWIPD